MAGEICPPELVSRHRERAAHARLFNEYGPTEATVWSTVFDTTDWKIGRRVPIGRPITNTAIYILDRRLQLVPVGAVGEIARTGVARVAP